jgi:hypothetical protein
MTTDMFDAVLMTIWWWLLPISLVSKAFCLAARKLQKWFGRDSPRGGWLTAFAFFPLRVTVFAIRCIVGVYLSMWVGTGVRLLQLTATQLCRSWLLKLTTDQLDNETIALSTLAHRVAWQ